ncbi:MAG: thioredoxin family protein [Pyrinomonadaceae bacterium]
MDLQKYLDASISFSEYLSLIDSLLAEGKTTGANQSEAMVGYGNLNRQRMARLTKTVLVDSDVNLRVRSNRRPQVWLIITEGWCGDAAQNIPVIEKVAAASESIDTRYVLRDENLELMDAYLTDGARSIPKLIALDAETHEVLFTWGARPGEAQEMFKRLKAEGIEKSIISEELQRWYNTDKGLSLQRELATLVESTQNVNSASTAT